jgi:hypothetical protein
MEPYFTPYVLHSAFQTFYHYQPFNRLHLETLLRDKKLFFSDPCTFNDPWDCRPRFSDRRLDALQDILADSARKVRIYCLSVIGDSTLMWSHYSQNHRGICLEFDTNNPLIQKARPCRYRNQYPEWPDLPLGLAEVFLAKAMDWSYEREFRLFGSSSDSPAKLDGDFVRLPDGALTAIILGCQSHHHAEVYELVKQFAPGLPIKQMVRIPHRYKLSIEPWQPAGDVF